MWILFYLLAIIGELESLWQSAVSNIVSADIVSEVDEVCSLGTYSATESNGIINQLVAMVYFLKAEGINDEDVNVVEVFIFRILYALHVGDIRYALGGW